MFTCIAIQWVVASLVSLPFALSILPYCTAPQWLLGYTVIISIVVPALITLGANLFIFKYIRASSHRIYPQATTCAGDVIVRQRRTIPRRDLYLLQHMTFMFSMFVIGWAPIFCLVAIDYHSSVSPLVYTLLQVFAVFSLFVCMCDLFLCNQDFRRYLRAKILVCF
ncbi:unnamed protein product [Adineta ricciae]|uniref:G-protein coupled receptors family 1 profile domain-containing protein n=1 Tax=Adineta ricciae TaxID=249248 RepID=A0A815PPJ4_ADIRI|nr:unnamed protein product [Adineta ricciae]CAF1451592.1 unnamed protein product [Adineta ricciae]